MKKKLLLLLPFLSLLFTSCNTENNVTPPGGDDGTNAQDNTDSQDNTDTEVDIDTSLNHTFNVNVKKVNNITDDFICGFDASSVISLENSGVTYKDYTGTKRDLFDILSDHGVNYIRVRIWNDPYNADGKGYGGGNCDLAKAIEIGKRATKYGMKLLVDFHYSDCWTDPKKYKTPKAWEGMDINEKSTALYNFTVDSLTSLENEKVDVGMVQIGNEINNGIAGEGGNSSNYYTLLKSASNAVRHVYPKTTSGVKIAVHYTDAHRKSFSTNFAQGLYNNNVDYDIFGASFYYQYHGTLSAFTTNLNNVVSQYNKEVIVLETSYPFTTVDTDGEGNLFGSAESDAISGYDFSIQGQTNTFVDLCDLMVNSINNHKGLGVFYWEGAWITVGKTENWSAANQKIWDKYGSGWISKYAEGYETELPAGTDGKYYSHGSTMDNQAVFNYDGTPLDSIAMFKYLKTGYTANVGPGETQSEEPTIEDVNIYLNGTFTNWKEDSAYKFSESTLDGCSYELLNISLPAGKLKVEGNGWKYEWNYVSYISPSGVTTQSIIGSAKDNFSNDGSKDNNISFSQGGTFNFYITTDNLLRIDYAS